MTIPLNAFPTLKILPADSHGTQQSDTTYAAGVVYEVDHEGTFMVDGEGNDIVFEMADVYPWALTARPTEKELIAE